MAKVFSRISVGKYPLQGRCQNGYPTREPSRFGMYLAALSAQKDGTLEGTPPTFRTDSLPLGYPLSSYEANDFPVTEERER